MISRAIILMIVANPSNKTLSKLVPPPSVIDVKVMVTLQLSVVVKLRSLYGVPTEAPESDSKEFVYQQDPYKDGDSDYDQEGFSVKCKCTRLAPFNYIYVVRCVFS